MDSDRELLKLLMLKHNNVTDMTIRIEQLERQKAQLLEVLKQIMDDSPCDPDTTGLWWKAWQRAEAAITAMEEE